MALINKKINFLMWRRPQKIHPTKELTDEDIDALCKQINQLQGEQKREETIREKKRGH